MSVSPKLPQAFIENMKKQLPANEQEAFFAVYTQKPYKGVRLNPLKGGRYAIKPLLPFLGEQIPWEENGFYTDEEKIGGHPLHFAGAFYSQEPSAMSAAPLLDVQPHEKVLDLCSAPGGKGTQLACQMQGKGLIVLNEPVYTRAKILLSNVERMGIKNAVVTSHLPEELSPLFPCYFDKILVDAPCSGEGMFRKNSEEALAEWSEENVALCAKRQKHILEHATKMLKLGGRLVYSTCTFAESEDEGQVRDYLQNYPQMRLIKQEKLYPHKVKGEGHFVAVFEKTADENCQTAKSLPLAKPQISKTSEKLYRAFESACFTTVQFTALHEANGNIYGIPDGAFAWKGLKALRVGVHLGEMKNGRFEPSQALALSAKAEECKNTVRLTLGDARTEKYLRGETIDDEGENGWCVVCVENCTLGFGKRVQGTVKNHLPKAVRKRGE